HARARRLAPPRGSPESAHLARPDQVPARQGRRSQQGVPGPAPQHVALLRSRNQQLAVLPRGGGVGRRSAEGAAREGREGRLEPERSQEAGRRGGRGRPWTRRERERRQDRGVHDDERRARRGVCRGPGLRPHRRAAVPRAGRPRSGARARGAAEGRRQREREDARRLDAPASGGQRAPHRRNPRARRRGREARRRQQGQPDAADAGRETRSAADRGADAAGSGRLPSAPRQARRRDRDAARADASRQGRSDAPAAAASRQEGREETREEGGGGSGRMRKVLGIAFVCLGVTAFAQAPVPAPAPAAPTVDQAAKYRTWLNQNCVGCHSNRVKQPADDPINLEAANTGDLLKDAATWERVLRKLAVRAMPPQGTRHPAEPEYVAFTTWLSTSLDRAWAGKFTPGRFVVHRLNRTEYGNAIRDLLALDINVNELLPSDGADFGFDNIASALKTSPLLLERYLTAAQRVSLLAVGDTTVPPGNTEYPISREFTQSTYIEGLPLGTQGGTVIRHIFPADGEYKLSGRLIRGVEEGYGGVEGNDQP